MKKMKFISLIIMCLLLFSNINIVLADEVSQEQVQEEGENQNSDFWSSANSWWGGAMDSGEGTNINTDFIGEMLDILSMLGNTLITIVTMILGLKYVFGSVDSKAEVKSNAITLLVASMFLFGWDKISKILIPGGNKLFIGDMSDMNGVVANVSSIVLFVLSYIMVIAIIYVGVRYLMAGATGKAEFKSRMGIFIIGLILAYQTVNVLTFISKVIGQSLSTGSVI